jgi:catechol 2,3-dioxygenase-like lactoylglutathione lyase family enzyme
MPTITSLGHVGLHCDDLDKQLDFYTRVLGFKLTDANPERGMYFLSTRPAAEHHMLLLMPGGRGDGKALQQLSFHTGSVGEVREFYQRLKAEGATIASTITHGNAVSVYFLDPEGNRLEVYWDTGILVHQPFREQVDLDGDDDAIMAQVREAVARVGKVWDPALV